MLSKFTLPICFIAFIAFLMIYPLDAIVYIGSFVFSTPPAGLIGFVIGLFLIPFFIIENRPANFYYTFLPYLILVILSGVLIILSEHYVKEDLWLFFRLFFSAFIIGYFTIGYFKLLSKHKTIINAFLIVIMVGLGLFITYHSFSKEAYLTANYLRFSESIALSGFVLLVLTDKILQKVLLASLMIIILFMAESRFSLFAFTLSASIYFFLISRKLFYYFIGISFGIILVVVLITPEVIFESRFYRLIFTPNEDTSLIARKELFTNGFEVFKKQPIWGDYAYYRFSCSGCYVHNFMSFLFEFGIIGLNLALVVILLTFRNLIITIKNIKLKKDSEEKYFYEIYLLFSIYILFGVLFSKHWDYTSFFFLAGTSFFMLKHRLMGLKFVNNIE
jgi:O-antigen ligase